MKLAGFLFPILGGFMCGATVLHYLPFLHPVVQCVIAFVLAIFFGVLGYFYYKRFK